MHGQCALVRIQGNGNFVWIDRETQVAVEGNDNVVYIYTSTTRVRQPGNGNRLSCVARQHPPGSHGARPHRRQQRR